MILLALVLLVALLAASFVTRVDGIATAVPPDAEAAPPAFRDRILRARTVSPAGAVRAPPAAALR